jgi:predicted enzyme related to lactoylglutathione lyase
MKNSLVHFEVPVNDPEKMSKFYSQAFGWDFEASPMGEGQTYWLITTGPQGKSLAGGMYKKETPDEFVRFYVGDDDLDGAISRFETAGGSLIRRFEVPGMVTGALLRDPENNVVGIIKNTTQRAPSRSRSSSRKSRSAKKKSAKSSRKRKK